MIKKVRLWIDSNVNDQYMYTDAEEFEFQLVGIGISEFSRQQLEEVRSVMHEELPTI